METLPDYVQLKPAAGVPLRDVFPAAGDDVLQVIMATLAYDPLMRHDCTQVNLRFFNSFT